MDSNLLIAALTPSKIIIQTSILPLITIEPAKKSWIGEFLAPKIYAVIGANVIRIDPALGAVALSSQAEIDALPNNLGNLIVVGLAGILAVMIIRKVFKNGL